MRPNENGSAACSGGGTALKGTLPFRAMGGADGVAVMFSSWVMCFSRMSGLPVDGPFEFS